MKKRKKKSKKIKKKVRKKIFKRINHTKKKLKNFDQN